MLRFTSFGILLLPISAILPCLREFRALDTCHSESNGCENCKILALPRNPFSAGFCGTANDALCNSYGCCSDCTVMFNEYESCLDTISLRNCDLDCKNAPTPAPTPAPTTFAPSTTEDNESILAEELEDQGCLEKFGQFAACATRNPICIGCFIQSIPDDVANEGFCATAEDTICGFGTCCEPCLEEFGEFDTCFETIVQDVTFGSCQIDCDNFEPPADQLELDMNCGEKLIRYRRCATDHPTECLPCGLLNLPEIEEGGDICSAATKSMCGFAQCCSSCEEKFQEFDECFESWLSVATSGQCEIDCDTFEGGDEDTIDLLECSSSLRGYISCVQDNPFECGLCAIQNLPNPDDEFCQAATETLCGFGSCCSSCESQFDNFEKCIDFIVSADTGCDIDCSEGSELNNNRALHGFKEI